VPAAHVAKPSLKHRHATRKPAHRAVAERAEPIPAKRKAAPDLAKAAPKPMEPERAAPPATVASAPAKVASKPAAPELAKAVPATLKSSTTADEAALPSPAPAVQARFSDADADAVRPRTIDALPSPPEDVASIPAVVAPDAREGKAPAAGPTRVATLESGIAGRTGAKPALTLSFAPGSTALSPQSNDTLQQFARTFAARPGRLEITAYANSGDGSAAGARRLSLKRALAVRAVLLDQGVAATRMDVRALGGSGGVNGDPNRLELTVEGAPRGAAPNGRAGGG
jgi:outer membrane protein OmpA-like peptidoglycan-associated protein